MAYIFCGLLRASCCGVCVGHCGDVTWVVDIEFYICSIAKSNEFL